jgi:hypothetical protein
MDHPFTSLNIVDKFLAATDELLGFTKPIDGEGIETQDLARILKKYCPDQWYIEEDDFDECE